ncbi:hypothetical protein HPP92_007605 [Vanilla planifolia]|uniref:Uncharacterized protein n=1 Tax=Vanilla planifolia TaxID=51239 RepID=A0A835RRP9_VANPL|nr:hypothetical protein HPP92_007605 [Vanilla planifolia]
MVRTVHSAASSDDDWILHADWRQTSTTAAATDITSYGDWVLAENPLAPPRQRLLGVFVHSGPGRHAYAPLIHPFSAAVVSPKSRAAYLMSSLPSATTICASSHGFVLARGPWSSYLISVPSSKDWAPIPKPPSAHSISAPLAFAAHSGRDFLVICAVSSMKGLYGFYRFEIYDSSTGHWTFSGDLFPMGLIVDSFGVSCCETVFFRTAVPSIAAFDTATGLARVLAPPPRCLEKTVLWQLVEAGGRLRCVCVMEGAVEVYQLGRSPTSGERDRRQCGDDNDEVR